MFLLQYITVYRIYSISPPITVNVKLGVNSVFDVRMTQRDDIIVLQ